jgi:proteasome lid subunit RPN8/RPN11
LTSNVIDELKEHARISTGECCGFLIGPPTQQGMMAVEAIAVRNVSLEPDAFAIAPTEAARVSHYALRRGKAIVAVYHQHALDLQLSRADRTSLASSTYHWLIFSSVSAAEAPGAPFRAAVYQAGSCEALGILQLDPHVGGDSNQLPA